MTAKEYAEEAEQYMTALHKAKESTFTIRGEFGELPKEAELGDVVLIKNDYGEYDTYAYFFVGTQYQWELLPPAERLTYRGAMITDDLDCEYQPRIQYPTNCKNCGAVLNNGKCEYCGTDYR